MEGNFLLEFHLSLLLSLFQNQKHLSHRDHDFLEEEGLFLTEQARAKLMVLQVQFHPLIDYYREDLFLVLLVRLPGFLLVR